MLGTLYAREQAYEKAVDWLKKAHQAAPESDKAAMIQMFIQRAERELKRQQAEDKADKADKEKAKPAAVPTSGRSHRAGRGTNPNDCNWDRRNGRLLRWAAAITEPHILGHMGL